MPRWTIWAVLLPLVVAGTVTAFDSHADGGIATAAAVLSVCGALHALRPRARLGTPAQGLGQVAALAVGAAGTAGALLLALLAYVLAGWCEGTCPDDPDTTTGHVLGAVFLVAAPVCFVAGVVVWRRIQRARIATGGDATAPAVLLALAAAVWFVWLVGAFVDRAPLA